MEENLSDIELAHRLADSAREIIRPLFRNIGRRIETKPADRFDPVTEADRAVESAIRSILATHRPKDGIIGEEYGIDAGTNGRDWVIDPIDGTRGFVCGTPTWGVLIAMTERKCPTLGIIDQPYIGERFVGAGDLAEMSGPFGTRQLQVSGTVQLGEAFLFSTFPEVGSPAERAGFTAVSRQCRLTRYGMDCYAYALLAAGQIDLVIEAGLRPYDILAPIAVVEAAGGMVTDWRGLPAHDGGRVLAAATPELHFAALRILESY